MSRAAVLTCRCGEVRGSVTNASSDTVNRVVCYCDDCQAFLHELGRADVLDAHGGTDIVQVAPSALSFDRGADRIAGLRLGPKGLFRFYTSCCKTPVGNAVGPAIPFVGISAKSFEGAPDELFGKPIGGILGKFGIGAVPEEARKLNPGLLWRAGRMVLGWKLRGHTWPHPFWDRGSRSPRPSLRVLTRDERQALRPLCGPK